MDERHRTVAQEGFAHEVQHDTGILTHGPEHRQILCFVISLSDHENTFVFQLIQVPVIHQMSP
jgi:hypothetical protein